MSDVFTEKKNTFLTLLWFWKIVVLVLMMVSACETYQYSIGLLHLQAQIVLWMEPRT